MSDVYLAQYVLLTLGVAFAAYWAYQAFDRPPIKLGDGPTLPRYMTQPSQYRLGVIVFVGTCLLVYYLIAYFHQELVPIVGAINPELQRTIEKSMKNGSLPYPLSVIFSAAIFVSLLKVEKDWNPIFVLRRVVHGWVSIPQIADALMLMIRDELTVPPGVRAEVAADPDSPHVTVGDFDKGRRTVDRSWAELCYIRHWLEHHRSQASHYTFFNEPSFAWEKLEKEYGEARDRIAPLKRGEVRDGKIFDDVAERIEALRRQYCRLAACFLVFKNDTQKDALRDAREFGVTVVATEAPRANPLRYVAIIVVTIIIAVYLGVSTSAVSWDLLHHNQITVGSEIATKWMLFGLANYGMPIIAVLLLRYLGWRVDRSQPNSYLASYAMIFVVALCVSVICLCLAQMALGPAAIADISQFLQRMRANFKWSFSPAIVAIYTIYHVDRQIDPLLPDIGPSEHWRLPQRLMSCIFFGLLVTGFSVLPTLDIEESRSAWTLDKLRIVILGTTFIVGLTMALVGEFLLVSPATSGQSERAAAPPATRLEPRTRLLLATASLVAVFLVGVAVWASSTSSVPQWAFDKKTVYLGEKIPLAWTYKLPASSAPVQFEIESGAAGKFQSEWCTDAEHHFVNRVNATREWRVRAVADCVSKTPVSSWSRSIEITQYDNIYQRIKARGQVDVFASQSQDQDFFKWSSNEGFDIDLANVIVRDLSSLMNRPLKLHLRTVKWENLLPAAGDTSTDFAISSITKKPWREDKFSIQFTDSYYCTGYALVFRAGMQDGRIADMIKGKVVGVQAETTSATLVGHLATGGLFTVRSFDTNEHLQNELVASKIDFGVTDTAFAQSAQLDTEGQLKFKQFGPDDLTATKDEPIQEYAIAVHRGETELLRAINQTLARVKGDSEMTRLYASATARYEEVKKYAPGSRSVGPRPWECYGQTASGN